MKFNIMTAVKYTVVFAAGAYFGILAFTIKYDKGCPIKELKEANAFKKKAIDQFFIYMDNCEEMIDEMSQDSLVNFMDVYGECDHYDMMVQCRDSINRMLAEEL